MRLKPSDLCYGCEKLNEDMICGVYGVIGMRYRTRTGMCPVTDRYADWRDDKPKVKIQKVRIGQQKTKGR